MEGIRVYPYTAVTPAMAAPRLGKGPDYVIAFVDSKKQILLWVGKLA